MAIRVDEHQHGGCFKEWRPLEVASLTPHLRWAGYVQRVVGGIGCIVVGGDGRLKSSCPAKCGSSHGPSRQAQRRDIQHGAPQ